MFISQENYTSHKDTQEHKKFIEWFIGFVEGYAFGGYVRKSHSMKIMFVIHQKYPKVLHKIKKHLGFGRVTGPFVNEKNKGIYFQYAVSKQEHVRELIQIFNGRFVLKKTKKRFEEYLKTYNSLQLIQQTSSSIDFQDNLILPTLQDGWLSGFLDAEGRFSGTVQKDWFKISISVSLVQKEEKELFEYLKSMLGGSLSFVEKSSGNISCLKIESIADRERLMTYLDEYKLKSEKYISFCRFKKIHVRLTDGKFSCRMTRPKAQKRLVRLIKNINII
jgi:hypothetical protein